MTTGTSQPKPPRIQVQETKIPEELKTLPQWLCWDLKKKGDGWTKPPIDPKNDKAGDSTDPATWGSFDQAIKTYKNNPILEKPQRNDSTGTRQSGGYYTANVN